MPNTKNIQKVQELKDKMQKSKSIILMDYKGLDSNQMNDLKSKIKEDEAELNISKNTLFGLALESKAEKLSKYLTGQTAAIFSYKDPISPLKTLVEYAKQLEKPQLKAGIIEENFTSAERLKILSELPSKDALRAHALGSMKSPINGIVHILGGTQTKFVRAINELAAKKKL